MNSKRATAWVLSLLLFASVVSAQGEKGKIVGTVIDDYNAMTLPMCPVTVVGTDTEVFTQLDGQFNLELDPGTYKIKVEFPAYETKTVSVEVVAGETQNLNIVLGLVRFAEEVLVTAEAATPELYTSEAQLVERKKANVIADNLAREEMTKNADSTAASAMQRVTGISVVDNQYVFVRGLGERYSNTTLNGSIMPTTEPDKKVVPLDLFPTGLVESIQVVKSYLPDKPADFAGGLVMIEPRNFPDARTMNVGMNFGTNGQTTFDPYLNYPGGSTDWAGIDDGTRALPAIIPNEKVVRGSALTDRGFSPGELETFGKSFANTWEPRLNSSASPNQSYSLVYGDSGEKLGGIFSFTYKNDNQYVEEEQNFYKVSADTIALQNDYDFKTSTNKVTMGMVGNLAYRFSPNNRIAWENFYSRNSKNETRTFEGFNKDIRTDIRNSRLYWIEEGLFSTKFSGQHFVQDLSNSQADWRFTYSKADRDEPDLREVLYEYRPSIDDFVLADESQSGFRMYNGLDDHVYDFAFDWSVFTTQWNGLPAMVKFGPALTYRERDFASRRFRFTPRNTIGVDLTQSPEVLFSEQNLSGPNPVFELNEETRRTDAYTADHKIYAAYGMVDLPLADDWRFVGGVRIEKSEQNVISFDPFAPAAIPTASNLDNTDVLPGISVIYRLNDSMNLRGGLSRTVNRPEFRELAEFEFTDVVGGRAVVGNPDLQRALISNYDVRWEWFPSASEVIAASVFYKDFTDPIERTVQATAQLRTSYQNANGAVNKGFELEARKGFGRWFFAGVNYTFVDSNIELSREAGDVQTTLERPLAGQSQNVFNGMFEFNVPEASQQGNLRGEGYFLSGLSVRALVNFFGDRISDVGSLGLPDIIEGGRTGLDITAVYRLHGIAFRFSAENLLNTEHLYTQGGETQRLFKLGRTFAFGLGYAVF